MTCIDGFLLAVPTSNKDAYKAFAEKSWPLFKDFCATAMRECRGMDVPHGKVTSISNGVEAGGG